MALSTRSPELRVSEHHWQRLRRALDGSFRSEELEERGALALLGEIASSKRPAFTVAEVILPGPDDVRQTRHGLIFDSRYLRRAHVRMRERRLAALATFHTHPLSDDTVQFSSTVDNVEDPKLISNLIDIEPGTRLVSIVLGRRSQSGRVWTSATDRQPLSRLVVVGERLQVLPLDGSAAPQPPSIEVIFDRARALTSEGALHALAGMTIAIVGASGIGSLVAELLVRAGCRLLLIVDDDIVKDVNLNRLPHARMTDISKPKATLLADRLHEIGFDVAIKALVGNVLDRDVIARLRDVDLVLGCVDRAWPRDLLAEFAFRYLIPYLDLGTEIGSDKARTSVMSLDARVSYIAPGRPCHRCTSIVTPRRLHFESLARDEQKRVVRLGYSDDLLLEQPAVMDLNMRAAGLGTLVLRHLLQPFLLTPLPVMLLENIVTFSIRAIPAPRTPNPNCPICRQNPYFGCGDGAPPLGLGPQALATVVGPRG